MAKLYASETAMWCTWAAVQTLGGWGYSREYPVEKWMRDAKLEEIEEGTSDIQRLIISRRLLGVSARPPRALRSSLGRGRRRLERSPASGASGSPAARSRATAAARSSSSTARAARSSAGRPTRRSPSCPRRPSSSSSPCRRPASRRRCEASLAAGAKALVAISAGLGEMGPEGRARERAIVERVRAAGRRARRPELPRRLRRVGRARAQLRGAPAGLDRPHLAERQPRARDRDARPRSSGSASRASSRSETRPTSRRPSSSRPTPRTSPRA